MGKAKYKKHNINDNKRRYKVQNADCKIQSVIYEIGVRFQLQIQIWMQLHLVPILYFFYIFFFFLFNILLFFNQAYFESQLDITQNMFGNIRMAVQYTQLGKEPPFVHEITKIA